MTNVHSSLRCLGALTACAAGSLLIGVETAQAQGPSPFGNRLGRPYSRPVTSPYLNLLRRDGGIGFQYYRRVLPEREFRRADRRQFEALNQLSRRIDRQRQPETGRRGSGLGTTGHPTTFLNIGGFFGGGASGTSDFGSRRR